MRWLALFILTACVIYACSGPVNKKDSKTGSPWLNHSDSAHYVGINTCKTCHADIYNTFIKTGMGKSFDLATRAKSSADFKDARVYDRFSGFNYEAFWRGDSLYFHEFRLLGKDTLSSRIEQVNYIIGSGQHTNSHLQSVNGYINQMPMTFYTQSKRWDLPPGFENGYNTRFSRKIGLECMSCHNSFPDFVEGSENKYKSVPQGIGCERCHGPGSIHVAQRKSQAPVDTSKYIDYSIVNPGKLSPELQFDICQRCHLQGNAVLKEGHSFYDFRPGMKLSEHMAVFLPKYKNADEEFIMASHADRLKQSPCFIKSASKSAGGLRPSRGAMTCVTCHNPHVSVRETNPDVFNQACLNCHTSAGTQKGLALMHSSVNTLALRNCVSCHMPSSGSSDIPHVTVHDHYIRKPVTRVEKEKIKSFLGLFSINDKNPGPLVRARAYMDQYDKFGHDEMYLDSAGLILSKIADRKSKFHVQVQYYFSRMLHLKIIEELNAIGDQVIFKELVKAKSLDNRDAWTAYRIAEAFSVAGDRGKALIWFERACELEPYNLDFRNKLGSTLAELGQTDKAIKEFEFIISENPNMPAPYSNLGYLRLVSGQTAEAYRLYQKGINLDPDNEPLLLNLTGYYLFMKNRSAAIQCLNRILSKNPQNQKARSILSSI